MKTAIYITSAILLSVALGLAFINSGETAPEINLLSNNHVELAQMYSPEECTDTRAAECAVFIASTIQACVTAMEAGGVDILADIRCARARKLITTKKDCIPCLCEEVKKRGWKWAECP